MIAVAVETRDLAPSTPLEPGVPYLIEVDGIRFAVQVMPRPVAVESQAQEMTP